ncbi:sodium:solute symporter [Paracidobacterium acidisoli]|uniref:Sodium:solute symporter n=1 Tax=Paracidobacterium acidisoli TaxID=2303751 RepID=A0A372IKE9_9BACT|nr:sodium:solute symporter [Paracidobacterium acidisoli]MBT9332591.1 sodium:solute symporter [Paracidobacterium acidisoli]
MHILPASGNHLRAIDLLLVGVYLAGITLFGLRFRKGGERSLRSYFLADRNVPWWAIALSIVAAETSTLTIISVPGLAFTGDFGFLQLAMGYLLGRVVICILFLPRYFRGDLLTAYQLIGQRFGPRLQRLTALLFLVMRAAAEGVRVFAVAIVVGVVLGTGDIASIAILSVLTLLYTFEGGMAAVIWTDVVQMILYVLGSLIALWTVCSKIPGGWSALIAGASAAHKLTVLHFSWSIVQTYTFQAGIIGGCFLTMASHGTDQLMVQRLLAAKNLRQSQLALLSSGLVVFFQFTLFLLIGAGLFVYYQRLGAASALSPSLSADRLFPAFIVHDMPAGIAGLMIAAVLAAAMSNLSAALNSLSSTTVVDFYAPRHPEADDRRKTHLSRIMTVVWAVVLFVLAMLSRRGGHVVEIGLSIASVLWGAMLGVFLLGTLSRRAAETGTILGMAAGVAVNLLLWLQPAAIRVPVFGHALLLPKIAWTWFVMIGALTTVLIGYIGSVLLPQPPAIRNCEGDR